MTFEEIHARMIEVAAAENRAAGLSTHGKPVWPKVQSDHAIHVAARRKAVLAGYLKGLTQKEIADAVNASLGTVNNDLARMREAGIIEGRKVCPTRTPTKRLPA